MFGTTEQKERWLQPLLEGEIRSCFAMTEPAVASSDATNIECSIRRDGDEYVINGRKWWISGAASHRCKIAIVMGKTDPDAPTHLQQSMVLVPLDTPGLTDRPSAAGVRLPGPRGPLRDRVRRRAGAGHEPARARRVAASPWPRPAWAPAASITACAASAWPSGRSKRCAAGFRDASRSARRSPSRA